MSSARTITVTVLECFKPLFIIKRELAHPSSVSQWVVRVSEEDRETLAKLANNRVARKFNGFFVDASSCIPAGLNTFILWNKFINNKPHVNITWLSVATDDTTDAKAVSTSVLTSNEEIAPIENCDSRHLVLDTEVADLVKKLQAKLQVAPLSVEALEAFNQFRLLIEKM